MLVRRGLALLAAAALTLSLHPVTSSAEASEAGSTAEPAAAADKRFERLATFPVFQNVPAGTDPAAETVAEISAVTDDGKTVIYTDALGKRIGFVDITDPAAPTGTGTIELASLGAAGDSPTSVTVVGGYALLVVDETAGAFTQPKGRLDVIKLSSRTRVRSIDLGGQPDSIAVSKDQQYAAIAIENQRDEDVVPSDPAGGDEGDLPQLPAGGLQIVDLSADPASWTAHAVPLTNSDGTALPALTAAGLDTPQDPEPEYVSINDKNQLALTLQENNGIVVVDLATRAITNVFNAGTPTITGVDVKKDGLFDPTGSVSGPREPDSIAWINNNLVATANEGDWKGGSRGWTIFNAHTGGVVWDAGNSFENIATAHGLHNNDRAAKKGVEPEGLAVATIGGTRYAFVGSERGNFVAVYDLTDSGEPRFVQAMPATNGPEGLLPIPERDLFVVSSEADEPDKLVRATVGVYQLGSKAPAFPSIVAEGDPTGTTIGWGALGALAAVPGSPGEIYAASDAAYKTGRIYTINTATTPAEITDVMEVTENGQKLAVDIEGLHVTPTGNGILIAVEGATGAANKVLALDSDGQVQMSIPLPAEVAAHVGKWGLEGVTSTGFGTSEEAVYVALQRPLFADPANPAGGTVDGDNVVRIGRYDLGTQAWTWFGYRLETTTAAGDWLGLSEITAVDQDTLAVIERDKLNGPAAAVKRVYTVDIPATTTGALTMLDKRLAVDVLPRLRALDGWTQEKLEGLTIGADHQVYAVTDNDGLVDATGETQLLRLGPVSTVFADAVATSTTLELAPKTVSWPGAVKAVVRVTGKQPASGSIAVKEGTKVLGTATLTNGTATLAIKGLKPGTHQLRASYAGSAAVGASTSAPATVTVKKAVSATKLTVSKKQVRKGGTITATAVLAPKAATGWVEFRDGTKVVKKVKLVGGKAVARLRFTGVGLHKLKAVYLGDTYTNRSTSARVTIKVTR